MEIPCEFKFDYDMQNPKYKCIVRSAKITKPDTKVNAFHGVHVGKRNDFDVNTIQFLGSRVEYFPQNLKAIFPNLTNVIMNNCGLKVLTRRDLMVFSDLREVYFSKNQLKSLPSDLFMNKPHLEVLLFNDNQLESIGSQLIKNSRSNKLHYVSFKKNPSINACFGCSSVFGIFAEVTLNGLIESIERTCTDPTADEPRPNFEELWMCQTTSNFIIEIASTTFHVHKKVLSQCSVFAAMFESNMIENHRNKMTVDEFSSTAFEEFLRYLYTGKDPDETNAMELFALAVKYDAPELKLTCEDMIIMNVSPSNALEILAFGKLFTSEEIKVVAFAQIKLMYPKQMLPAELIDEPIELILKWIEAYEKFSREMQDVHDGFAATVRALKPLKLNED